MADIKTSRFLGYTSKPGVVNTPGLGVKAENVIVNKGNLCNFPFTKRQIELVNTRGDKLLAIYKFYNKTYFILLDQNVNGDVSITAYKESIFDDNEPEIFDFQTYPFLGISFYNQGVLAREWLGGNILQVGEWLLFLTKTAPAEISQDILPRMLRIKAFNVDEDLGATFPTFPSPDPDHPMWMGAIGIGKPELIIKDSTDSGDLDGELDFAFTFTTNIASFFSATNHGTNELEIDSVYNLGPNDIESEATPYGSTTVFNGSTVGSVLFRIYSPSINGGAKEPPTNTTPRIGVYIRQGNQAEYYFYAYFSVISSLPKLDTDENSDGFGKWYFELNISPTSSIPQEQDANKLAPLDNRNVPRPAYHAAFFKNRIYYAAANDRVPRWQLNLMQYSALVTSRGIEANYIESEVEVGQRSEPITGFIQFLGQLLIFKETEIYVLTDDILLGEFRQIYSGLGCVNVNGGHGYIEIDGKVYFVDKTGIYMWDGQTDPIRISEPIQEDLDNIDERRYSFVRLSTDKRYGLLFVSFPRGNFGPLNDSVDTSIQPTFIYHYRESMLERGIYIWTKNNGIYGQHSQPDNQGIQIIEDNKNRYFLTSKNVRQLELLDDNPTHSSFTQVAEWKSTLLDLHEYRRFKHWKFLSISEKNGVVLFIQMYNSPKEMSGNTGRFNISRKLKEFNFRMSTGKITPSGLINITQGGLNVFRITGYKIDVHVIGRR